MNSPAPKASVSHLQLHADWVNVDFPPPTLKNLLHRPTHHQLDTSARQAHVKRERQGNFHQNVGLNLSVRRGLTLSPLL